MIDYNGVLWEDSSTNAFKECLDLFEELTQTKWFECSVFTLFLSKDDLLRELLQSSNNGLAKCFCHESNIGWSDEEIWNKLLDKEYYDNKTGFFKHDYNFEAFHDMVIDFIRNMFFQRNKRQQDSHLSCHIITALDSKAIHDVFDDVHKSILLSNLNKVGIVGGDNSNNSCRMGDSQLRVRSTSRSVDLSHTVTNTNNNIDISTANIAVKNINTMANDKDENDKAMFNDT